MNKEETQEILVNNWEKYHPRKDLKSMAWVRMSPKLLHNRFFYNETNNTKLYWFYLILATAESNRNGQHEVVFGFEAERAKIPIEEIKQALQVFENKGLISFTNGHDQTRTDTDENVSNVTERNVTKRNVTERNVTNETKRNETKKNTKTPLALGGLNYDFEDIKILWNQKSLLPKVKAFSETRKRKVQKLIKNYLDTFQNLSGWEALILEINASDFLTGKSTKWKASFDWIIQESNFIKVVEGNYKNQEKSFYDDNPYRQERLSQENNLILLGGENE